jgi:hypothetical protein
MDCATGVTIDSLGTTSCLCTVGGVVTGTTFPPSGGIGPSTTTTFSAGSIIYSNGTNLAQDNTNLNYNSSTHALTVGSVAIVPIAISGSLVSILAADVQTTNAVATTLFSIPTVSGGAHGTAYSFRTQIVLADATGGVSIGSYYIIVQAKNIGGTVTVSSIIQEIGSLEGSLSSTAITATTSGANVLIQVTGLSATNINWTGSLSIAQQTF